MLVLVLSYVYVGCEENERVYLKRLIFDLFSSQPKNTSPTHARASRKFSFSSKHAAIRLRRYRRLVQRRTLSPLLRVSRRVFRAARRRGVLSRVARGFERIRSRKTGEIAHGARGRDGVVSRVRGAVFSLAAAAVGKRRLLRRWVGFWE